MVWTLDEVFPYDFCHLFSSCHRWWVNLATLKTNRIHRDLQYEYLHENYAKSTFHVVGNLPSHDHGSLENGRIFQRQLYNYIVLEIHPLFLAEPWLWEEGYTHEVFHLEFCPCWRILGSNHHVVNHLSGQIIATSIDRFPPNGGFVREFSPRALQTKGNREIYPPWN